MLAIKSSRKQSLRLLSNEEDNLLAGIDFQTYYLGRKEIQNDNNDLDTVVEGIYSKYMYNGDINNSTQLTITVDTNQLMFRDVVTHHIEFIIALTSVKSVYCSSKKTKFPNAVILLCCLPSQSTATVHVLHCLNQSQARDFYNAINRAFDYHGDATQASKPNRANVDKGNKDLEASAVGAYKVNTTKSMKYRELNVTAPKKKETCAGENTGLLGAEELVPAKDEQIQTSVTVNEIVQTQVDDDARAKPRSRAKSSPQTKGAEGVGLLDNIDPDDGFDDEFTDLARNRSLSDNIKARFGR
ncbi:Hypothetical predicted protein [Paramuricea clavata]|uniref:Uncharacterized protein n=1 Tax=Paramuricea clavata TaxID=317549 RepID=A0A7D9EYX8_PARCT|nr:Hypothetical predicted protein [Paramuricea clavata]